MTTTPHNTDNEPTLEELVREHYGQLRGEFQVEQTELENIAEQALVRSKQLVALAVETAASLLAHADSDTVRWNVAKYLMDNHLFGKSDSPEDELAKIMKDLTRSKA